MGTRELSSRSDLYLASPHKPHTRANLSCRQAGKRGRWYGEALQFGNRGGPVSFTLKDGKLHDRWGDVFVRQ